MNYLPYFDATLAAGLAAALLAVVICVAAGALVGRGPSRWAEADMLVGFGLFGAFVTFFAIVLRIPLSWLFAAFAALSLVGLVVRRQFPGGAATWLALLLLSPIMIRAAGSTAALWDEVWHWLPNASYAYNHNSLAWPDLPPPFSKFPGYPQLIPLLIAEASLIAGRFLESAGPVINVMLLAASSALLAEAMTAALRRRGHLDEAGAPIMLTAAAVVITVLLNPGLDGGIVLSSYADSATMVAVGALGLIGIEILVRLSREGAAHCAEMSWRFGLIGAMLVGLKQANPVLLALVLLGFALIVLHDPSIPKRRALAQLPRMLAPAIFVFVLWHWYVARNLSEAAMAFRPLATWNFDVMDQTFGAFGRIIVERPLFYAMMWLVTATGVAAFFYLPRKTSEARWLAVLCAIVWLGYNAFLITVAVGAMSKVEAINGADYWRYTPHVALLGLYAPVIALAAGRWPKWIPLRGVAPAAVLIVLALFTLPLRDSLNDPPDRAWPRFLRAAVSDMAKTLPAGSKVVIVPCWNESPFAVIVRYQLWQFGAPGRTVPATILWDPSDLPKVAGWAAQGDVNYLIIQDGECSTDALTSTLRMPPLKNELALVEWRHDAWEKVRSWPIPAPLIRARPAPQP
jgi:hypothetical protein